MDHHRETTLVGEHEDVVEALVGDLEAFAARVQLESHRTCVQTALRFPERVVARVQAGQHTQPAAMRLRDFEKVHVRRTVAQPAP